MDDSARINAMGARWDKAVIETNEWSKSLQLERPPGTAFHRALDAWKANDFLYYPTVEPAEAAAYHDRLLSRPYQVFLVEHDWAAAFRGSQDYEGLPDQWDFLTPYPECCWEFQISGKRVCFLTAIIEGPYRAGAVMETSQGWMAVKLKHEEFRGLSTLAFEQVRAVTIALDAEVAKHDVVRAPHRLNRARAKRGRQIIADYHSVSLARRARPTPLPAGDENRMGVRLHFRRGHWRHFDNHKTWIPWTLVGDPDLGSIEKHYCL